MGVATLDGEAGRDPRPAGAAREVRVWDPLVRLLHWSLAATFVLAWASAEEWDAGHVLTGYAVAAIVALRLVWGLVGPRHARFSDFLYRPRTILAFLRDTLRLRAPRHLGHNPAGGAMVVAMLAMLAILAATGIMMTSDAYWGVEWVEEAHEAAASLALVLVGLHLAGVLVASLEHHENLVRAMLTGRKRAP